jgi:hypothetical protein
VTPLEQVAAAAEHALKGAGLLIQALTTRVAELERRIEALEAKDAPETPANGRLLYRPGGHS